MARVGDRKLTALDAIAYLVFLAVLLAMAFVGGVR
jgi:hypothetical protein